MGWGTLFSLTNLVALGAWSLLAFVPRRPVVLSAVLYLGVGLLCATYAAMFVALVTGSVDPGRVGPVPKFAYSIRGIRGLFAADAGIVIGWTHYLALDLFTGLWIARDADAKGFGRIWQLPFLLATFLAGPIGLLGWLIVREPAARRAKAGRRSR